MPTFDPSDLIGRTFLLPPEENGERHRDKVTRQVVEIIDQDNGQRVENINSILDIDNGKVEEFVSYNQLLEHLENAQDNDLGMDQELYRFRNHHWTLDVSGDHKLTCLGTPSPETTWRPCNLTLKTKIVNGMMPLN